MVVFKTRDAVAMHHEIKNRLANGEKIVSVREHRKPEASVGPPRPYVPEYQVHKVVLGRTT